VTLPIATIELGAGLGRIGLSHCPGIYDASDPTRDLAADIAAIRLCGAIAIVTLVERHELLALHVPLLGEAVIAAGLRWLHLPIRDMMAPDAHFEALWRGAGHELHRWLSAGESIHLHCRGGRGRAGTIAARLLIERGWAIEDAIRLVRAQRPGAIETDAQERYLHALRPAGTGE
jgi:ADP-ribosyl-[dinitrogen reductase] hydrolase